MVHQLFFFALLSGLAKVGVEIKRVKTIKLKINTLTSMDVQSIYVKRILLRFVDESILGKEKKITNVFFI